jgi:hypothetical protein
MKTARTKQLILSAVFLLLGACAPQTPPDVPSWDLDVLPILRGSCGHCHGVATVGMGANPGSRYDVCDASAFMNVGLNAAPGALTFAQAIAMYIKPTAPARMPPPPAPPLSDYDRTVLERWTARPSCAKQVVNSKPTLQIIDALSRAGDRSATVTIEVADPDGDQVLGKAKLGNSPDFVIPGSGRWTIKYTDTGANDRLSITLFDGYEAAQFMP